jgi:AmiR/NasT family two-component response regulator
VRQDDRNLRYSITGAFLNKGLRVVVFHPDDNDGATLIGHLTRIGCQVQAFWPPLEVLSEPVDVVFQALLPSELEPVHMERGPNAPLLISIIAHENPTFIDQSWKMGASAIITTPIRTTGLLSLIVFASQHARQAKQQATRITNLEKKLQDMRHLTEAKSILIRMHGIGEEEAYELLRSQAMAKRVTVEDICHSIIAADEVFARAAKKPSRGPPG